MKCTTLRLSGAQAMPTEHKIEPKKCKSYEALIVDQLVKIASLGGFWMLLAQNERSEQAPRMRWREGGTKTSKADSGGI